MQIDGPGPVISLQSDSNSRENATTDALLPGDEVSLSGKGALAKKPLPMFFSTLQASKAFINTVLSGAHILSGTWGLGIRREHTGITFPIGAPFVKPDNSVIVMGREEKIVINEKDLHIASKVTFGDKTSSPCHYAPAFGEDGTAYYVSEDQKFLCIRKDEVKSLANANEESITTPVAISSEGIAYGDRDGRICLLDFDGKELRSHYVPMNFSLAVHAPDGPEHVTMGKNGRIYVTTGDRRIFCFMPDDKKWEAASAFSGEEPARVTESADGSAVFAGAGSRFAALNSADGTEKWSLPLKGDVHWNAVQDKKGTLYVYAGSEVNIISPDGARLGSFGTGASKPWYGATRIAIDGNGNICLNVNHREFHIYTPEGTPIARLSNRDLFGNDAIIGDFSITPDGGHALITGREGDIAEVSLPESLDKRIASFEAEQAEEPSSSDTILLEDDTVWIAGVSLAKRVALAQSLLPFSPFWE